MKRVFSSSQEVFHLWAAQSQDEARQGGRITRAFFRGSSCWSYGHHYEVGRLVNIKGHQVALINASGYSHTTSKHISEARGAVSHLPTIKVDRSFDWKQGLLAMQGDLIDSIFDKFNSRKFYAGYCVWDKYQQAEFDKFNELCVLVGMPHLQLLVDDTTTDVLEEHVKACQQREAELKALKFTPEYLAKKEQRELAEEKRKLVKRAAEVEAWKLGGPFTDAVRTLKPQLIRIVGDEVQTSNQASVPLSEACRALMQIENLGLEKGTKIGSFAFNGVDNGLVTVGCHTIELKHAKTVLATALNSKQVG